MNETYLFFFTTFTIYYFNINALNETARKQRVLRLITMMRSSPERKSSRRRSSRRNRECGREGENKTEYPAGIIKLVAEKMSSHEGAVNRRREFLRGDEPREYESHMSGN